MFFSIEAWTDCSRSCELSRSPPRREREIRPRVVFPKDWPSAQCHDDGSTGEQYIDRPRAEHRYSNAVNSGTVNPSVVNYEQNTPSWCQKLLKY